jgi:dihydrofolate synthase / folylpolyglutamate synthase
MKITSDNLLEAFMELSEVNNPIGNHKKTITKLDYQTNPSLQATLLDQRKVLQNFLTHFGCPQNKFKVIHISGTSGKGTTSALISRILTQHNIPNGLFMTPYVYNVRELFEYNSKLISEYDLELYGAKFVAIAKKWIYNTGHNLNNQKLIFSFACYLFAIYKVKIAVIESFMGGRFDVTNIFERVDKTCVITAIGKDHQEYLGELESDRIWHKTGIVRANNRLVLGNNLKPYQKDLIIKEVASIASEILEAESSYQIDPLSDKNDLRHINFNWQNKNLELSLTPQQVYLLPNLPTALKACQTAIYPATIDVFELDFQTLLDPIPARLETKTIHSNKTQIQLILDGAHNTQKISFLKERLQELYPTQKFILLFSSGKGDQILEMMKILKPISSSMIASTFQIKLKDNRKIRESVQLLQSEQILLAHKYVFESDPKKALKIAIKEARESGLPILCTGSFYFVGLINQCLCQ